jgi:hypothetical protein
MAERADRARPIEGFLAHRENPELQSQASMITNEVARSDGSVSGASSFGVVR